MIKFNTIYLVLILSLFIGQSLFSSGIPVGGQATDSKDQILVNQVGYLPNSVKIALLRLQTDRFEVVDVKTGK
jgi:hypothetical protein